MIRRAEDGRADRLDALRAVQAEVAAVLSPVFVVGGSVRDSLLGREFHDLDLATPLRPEETVEAIRAAGLRPFVSGRKYGTVGFRVGGRRVDVTTFRTVAYARGSREPDVAFLPELAADLSHRDFTINAVAFATGELVDPLNGLSDLQAGVVRAPGKPRDRFLEDPVRLIRAARLVSQFGFEVEPETLAAMKRCSRRILDSAVERWTPELDAMLQGPNVRVAFRLLADTGVLKFVLPDMQIQVGYEQNSPYHDRDLFEHTMAVVEATDAGNLSMRWAALLHDIGKPYARVEKPGRSTYVGHELLGAELVDRMALYLRWSLERRRTITSLVAHHMDADSPLKAADESAKRARPQPGNAPE